MSRWCFEVVGISKHLVWCHIFGKCQNLGGIAITINLFLPMSRWCLEVVEISKHLVLCHIFGKCQNLGGIAITINLFLPMSRWCLEVVGISKHLFWCRIFEKYQNLGGSNEMYYAATVQFSKNVQFVHCNYHKFIFANE